MQMPKSHTSYAHIIIMIIIIIIIIIILWAPVIIIITIVLGYRLLAKYNRAILKLIITTTGVVIPLSWPRTVASSLSIHMDAVFITALVVRFIVKPVLKPSFQWRAINPME